MKYILIILIVAITSVIMVGSYAMCMSEYNLNTIIGGSGKGIILIKPENQSFDTSTAIKINAGTRIIVEATPNAYSMFSGWTGDCAGNNQCVLTMDTDKTINTTFINDMRISTMIDLPKLNNYSTLYDAYLAAISGSTIMAWGTSFSEDLILNKNKDVKINGGCNVSYSVCSEVTTIAGKLIIQNGSVIVNRLAISGRLPNHPPIANAGASKGVITGTEVELDGSISNDPDGDSLSYSWSIYSKPANSYAILSSQHVANPSTTVDVPGTYVFALVVNDGQVNSDVSNVTINVNAPNVAPVANSGISQNVFAGSAVTLDGNLSSDSNGDVLTYNWTFVSVPAGSVAALSNATIVNPQFISDVAGDYVLCLVVSDGKLNSEPMYVTIKCIFPLEVTFTITPGDASNFNLNINECASGSLTIGGYLWTYNNCQAFGQAGNNVSAIIENKSNNVYHITSLKLRYNDGPIWAQDYSITASSQLVDAYSQLTFVIPLRFSSSMINGIATFGVVELGNVSGAFNKNISPFPLY